MGFQNYADVDFLSLKIDSPAVLLTNAEETSLSPLMQLKGN